MIQFHFHMAESSFSDWIQAAMSIVQAFAACWGIYYIIQAFRQGNKNITLQIMAMRTANKPNLIFTPPSKNDINFSHTRGRIMFQIEVQNKDAFDLLIAKKSDHFELFDEDVLRLKIFYPRVATGNVISFGYELIPVQVNAPHPPLTVDMVITYRDELGFQYRQELSGRVLSPDVELSSAIYLTPND